MTAAADSLGFMLVQASADVLYAAFAWIFIARLSQRYPNTTAVVVVISGGVMFGVSLMDMLPNSVDRLGSSLAMHLFTAGFLAILVSNTLITTVGVAIETVSMQIRHTRSVRLQEIETYERDDDDDSTGAVDDDDDERGRQLYLKAFSKTVVILCACLVEGGISAIALSRAQSSEIRNLLLFASLSTDWTQAMLLHRSTQQIVKSSTPSPSRVKTFLLHATPLFLWCLATPVVYTIAIFTLGPHSSSSSSTGGDGIASLEAVIAGVYTYLGVVDILIPELNSAIDDAEDLQPYVREEQQLEIRYRTPPLLQGLRVCVQIYVRCMMFVASAWFAVYLF